jgi:two-component system NtrC family sensor kinase
MKLEIISIGEAGRTFEFTPGTDVTIGREESCGVCLLDRKVSRRHARLTVVDERAYLEDLGSANGVKVNGQRGFRFTLYENDLITIGDTTLKVTHTALPDVPRPRVTVDDATRTVVLCAMPHEQAGLLGTRVPPEVAEELRAENRYLRTLGEISRVLAAPHAAQQTLDSVLAALREALSADIACVLAREAEGREWAVRGMVHADRGPAAPTSVSLTLVRQAVEEGVAIIARDPLTDERLQGSRSIIVEGVSSALCSPIRLGGVFNAVLVVDRRRRSDVFLERDLRLTTTVANLLGLLLEKEQVEAEARQRERLAVIGEVVANLAHHAKNIIASLRFGLGTLKLAMNRGHTEKLPQYVSMIEAQQGRLSDLVLNMLSYSKERIPLRQKVRLGPLMEEVTEPFRARLGEAGVALHTSCEPPDLEIWAEGAALHRAFLNLLVNAIDALQTNTGREKAIRVTAERTEGRHVAVRFRDTGCGIPESERERIFDVFYSTKGAKGTGLGLAVVKKVVAEHGGTIRVDSTVNEGTEFTILLPESVPEDAGSAA